MNIRVKLFLSYMVTVGFFTGCILLSKHRPLALSLFILAVLSKTLLNPIPKAYRNVDHSGLRIICTVILFLFAFIYLALCILDEFTELNFKIVTQYWAYSMGILGYLWFCIFIYDEFQTAYKLDKK